MSWADFLILACHWKAHALGTLYNWQTLIAGMLALLGAYLTVKQIGRQINQANTSEERRRQREEDAAKAILPLSLSEIPAYCNECLQLLLRYVPAHGTVPMVPADLVVPPIPVTAIEVLQ